MEPKVDGTFGEADDFGRTTADRFYLNCKVVTKKMSYREHQSRGKEWNETAEVVLLIPEQTTEADHFLKAWLPVQYSPEELEKHRDLNTHCELVMEAAMPINGYFRGAVAWGNNLIPEPHIFVMTKGAEERLRSCVGKKIKVTTLGDGEEESLYELKRETKNPYSEGT